MTQAPDYILITVGSTGDLYPFLSIAKAFQTLGRQVTLITHSFHVPAVQQAGVPVLGLGSDEEYLELLRNPDIWHPQKSFAALMCNYGKELQRLLDLLNQLPGSAPKVVIAHPFTIPAAAISREQGYIAALVAAYLAPANIKSCHDPLTIGPISMPTWVPMSWRRAYWRFVEKGWIDPVSIPHINAIRAPLKLPLVDSFMGHVASAPDLSLTLFPDWFAKTAPDWPVPRVSADFPIFDLNTPAALPPEVLKFLAVGNAPLVFTAGTANLHAAAFFRHALAAVQKSGQRAIFLAKDRQLLPADLPPSVLWQTYVPLAQLLPHAAVMIHHGGIGTTAEALRAGTPQLITPFAWDQFDNGARIVALGVGQVIPVQGLSPRKLARTLQAIQQNPAIKQQCQQLAQQFKMPHNPIVWCTQIEKKLGLRCAGKYGH